MNRTIRMTLTSFGALAMAATAGCSVGGSQGAKTFTLGISVDPGSLDPQRTLASDNIRVAALAYDTPVILNDEKQLEPGILTKWEDTSPTTWLLTVRSGVSCSDGSAMNARTVADNLNYVADAKNANPYAGSAVPSGSIATADESANTVTVKIPHPASFFMQGLSSLPLVCEKGLADRSALASGSHGSGPYVVSGVAPGDHIEYTLRRGYTWGPAKGPDTAAAALPAKIVVKVISSATTTANLLVGGQLNAATVLGTDQVRLKENKLFSAGSNIPSSQLWFNHAPGLPTADLTVRKALAMALDTKQLAVATTAGLGKPATGQMGTPKVCPGDTVTGNQPEFDLAKAKAVLTADGWTTAGGTLSKGGKNLTITLAYSSEQAPASSAAQLIAADWKRLGVDVKLAGRSSQQNTSGLMGGTFSWDAALFGLGGQTPAQFVAWNSGPGAPKGSNFSSIDNPEYNSLVAKASAQAGTKSCAGWNAAEVTLFKNVDKVMTGQQPQLTYGKGATFKLSGNGTLLPTTIRMD
ncbi:ABC transporter substrate-binding protein [Streptomyces sp. NPDC004752]